MEDADIVPVDGWYRLAAAVVRGLPADDPERDRWRLFGLDLAHSLTPAHQVTRAARPGRMNTAQVETGSRISGSEGRRKSTRISARNRRS